MEEVKSNEPVQEFKKCGKCKRLRLTSCFAKSKRRPDHLQDWCRACVRERDQEKYHYENGKERTKAWNKRRRQKHMDKISAYLCAHKCADCGETDPIVLEFDHRDPTTKVDDIAGMAGYASWRKIELEIAKCDVVCASCHKRRTAIKYGWRRARLIHTIGKVQQEGIRKRNENKSIENKE